MTLMINDERIRINSVVFHLLSRGISEMGGSLNGSNDQHYVTAAEYASIIYPQDEAERQKMHAAEEQNFKLKGNISEEHVVDTIQDRLVENAHQWGSSNQASLLTRVRTFINR